MEMHLNDTKKKGLFLHIDNVNMIKWWVDASFGVHPGFRSHMGAMIIIGCGTFQSFSKNQKLNAPSSIESELVAFDVSIHIMWTKLFLNIRDIERIRILCFRIIRRQCY